jgi:hypothetical protein
MRILCPGAAAVTLLLVQPPRTTLSVASGESTQRVLP